MKLATTVLTIIALTAIAAIAINHHSTAEPRILIGEVTYSREQVEMSICIAGGGKAYFVPDETRRDGALSRYAGCNLYVVGAKPE